MCGFFWARKHWGFADPLFDKFGHLDNLDTKRKKETT